MPKNFIVPVRLNHTANALLYGASGEPLVQFQYQFQDISGFSIIEAINTFKYKDTNEGPAPLLKFKEFNQSTNPNGITKERLHDIITKSILKTSEKYRNGTQFPNDSDLAHHIIQWIASTLFGHPLAQAPITNENQIVNDISNGETDGQTNIEANRLGHQLYNAFIENDANNLQGTTSNLLLISIFEQMINEGRFDLNNQGEPPPPQPDTEGFVPFPFKTGDRLSFLVDIGCNLGNFTDTGSDNTSATNLSSLFQNTPGVNTNNGNVSLAQETWKFNIVITS